MFEPAITAAVAERRLRVLLADRGPHAVIAVVPAPDVVLVDLAARRCARSGPGDPRARLLEDAPTTTVTSPAALQDSRFSGGRRTEQPAPAAPLPHHGLVP